MDLPMVTDSHCHLHDMRLEIKVDEIIQRAKEHQVRHVISCGCHLEDWKRLERLYLQMYNKQEETSSGFKLTLCFGLHPWWAKADNNHGNYLEKLREKLLMYPTAHVSFFMPVTDKK
jgi:TatD DNase family protein